MGKCKIKIQDLSFYGDKSSSKYHASSKIEWDRTGGLNGLPVFFTDSCLGVVNMSEYKDAYKIAWLIEPYAIRQDTYNFVNQIKNKFDLVLSFDKEFLKILGDKGEYYPNGMSWVAESDWQIYPKSKNISIIASDKVWTEGHSMRHELINSYPERPFDAFGVNYGGFVKDKIDVLRDYRYHIVVENSRVDAYFTEKLIDCFATGTIPIYWGCPSIGDFFKKEGMLFAENINDLKVCIDIANGEEDALYQEALPHIKENFEIAKKYKVAEDYIFDNILQPRGLV